MNILEMPFEERIKRRSHIEDRFSRICTLGEQAEPPPRKTPGKRGRYKRTKGRNLVERLIRNKEAVLAFAFNKEVPFTNNLAYPNFLFNFLIVSKQSFGELTP
jgi:hypothetical protein